MAGDASRDRQNSFEGDPPSAFSPREQELFRIWDDKASWRGTIFLAYYYAASDGRIVVRRRKRWAGWSFNLAHRWTWAVMAVSAIVAFGPMFLMLHASKH